LVKECVSTRKALIQTDEHCPQRPFVELTVPSDARALVAVEFTTDSHGQGGKVRETAEERHARHQDPQPPLPSRQLRQPRLPQKSPPAGTSHHPTNRCSRPGSIRSRPDDVVQIVPRAAYLGSVNVAREGTISIEYEPLDNNNDDDNDVAGQNDEPQQSLVLTRYLPYEMCWLLPGEQQIRVLVVNPAGALNDPVQAHLELVDLGRQGGVEFDALSYCWGDSTERADMTLEIEGSGASSSRSTRQQQFGISPTIEAAVRRLRSPSDDAPPLRIWIDAVCINQLDVQERGRQVGLMGDICSRARAVHIWLGTAGSSGIETALRVVRDIYNYDHRQCPGGGRDRCRCAGTKHMVSVEAVDARIEKKKKKKKRKKRWKKGDEVSSSMWAVFEEAERGFDSQAVQAAGGQGNTHLPNLMQALFEHPWFQRVWVAQEATLARRALVHCGEETVEWKELLYVNGLMDEPRYKKFAMLLRGWRTAMPPVWGTLVGVRKRWRARDGDMAGDEMAVVGNEEKSLSILEVFLAAQDLKATDPRDKLFALLAFGEETSVAKDLPLVLRPSYDKPLANVMADFTRWWIGTCRSLDILSFTHCQPVRAWQRILCDNDPRVKGPLARPTWALGTEDYAKWARINLLSQFCSFRASNDRLPDLDLLRLDHSEDRGVHVDKRPVLSLRGHRVGAIVALDHTPRPAHSGSMQEVFDKMIDTCGHSGVWARPGASKDEQIADLTRLRWEYYDHLSSHRRYFQERTMYALESTGKGAYEQYETEEVPACIDRCFFVTADGRQGLCPWTAREGDVVAVLDGGRVPFLLRPVYRAGGEAQGGERGVEEEFELAGECFVEGIMEGEYLQGVEGNEEVFVLF
ncbi:heterokaryon incompatibility protein-domain-containing protein, partial [Bombardia bombarda]